MASLEAGPVTPARPCPVHGLYFGAECPSCPSVYDYPPPLAGPPTAPDAGGLEGPATAAPRAGRYDEGARRRAVRSGRERGCWVYIPLDEYVKAGGDPDGDLPYYRVWGRERGSVLVRLYGVR